MSQDEKVKPESIEITLEEYKTIAEETPERIWEFELFVEQHNGIEIVGYGRLIKPESLPVPEFNADWAAFHEWKEKHTYPISLKPHKL